MAIEIGLLVVDVNKFYSIFATNSYITTSPANKIIKKDNIVFLATNFELKKLNVLNRATIMEYYNYPDITAITVVYNKLLISNFAGLYYF